jgi:hypothetical protein
MKGKAKLDRVGDPSVATRPGDDPEDDLSALGVLLEELAGRPGPGTSGMQGIAAIVERARSGTLESAATFAALLRRLSA